MNKNAYILKLFLVSIICSSVSCSIFKHKSQSQSQNSATKKVIFLDRSQAEQKPKAEINQDQKDLDLVLKIKKQRQDSKKGMQSESQLYSLLLRDYERNDEVAFAENLKKYRQNYFSSHRYDEILFLAGQLAENNKNYGSALKYFNQILKDYPYSNKTVSALFAKGMVLKKMNLMDLSKDVFRSLLVRYPGSPDSLKAQSELKALR